MSRREVAANLLWKCCGNALCVKIDMPPQIDFTESRRNNRFLVGGCAII